ncbi:MAG: hypothetical protein V4631_10600 [Pseudomonadota bacterium]
MKKSKVFALAALGTLLSGCYVVPLNQYPSGPHSNAGYSGSGAAIVPMAAYRPAFSARLYPGNPEAARMGGVTGAISNSETGHGEFSFNLGGEQFAGEATRSPRSTKGVANAGGNRGGYVRCDYVMSTALLGWGSCTFSNGARYDMHISQ